MRLEGFRSDFARYFTLSGGDGIDNPDHHALIAIIQSGDDTKVKVLSDKMEALSLPDDALVIGQWQGKWQSDFFALNASDLKRFLRNRSAHETKE